MLFRSTNDVETIVGNNEVVKGEWHQVGIVWDSSMISLYLDGNFDGSIVKTKTISYPYDLPLTIGMSKTGYKYVDYFKGLIDEVVIYNRALSSGEITQLYNSGNGVSVSCGP